MTTFKVTLEYDGTRYSGWQEQKNARTVMGEIRKAAEQVFGGDLEMQGAGRTAALTTIACWASDEVFATLRGILCIKTTAQPCAGNLHHGRCDGLRQPSYVLHYWS